LQRFNSVGRKLCPITVSCCRGNGSEKTTQNYTKTSTATDMCLHFQRIYHMFSRCFIHMLNTYTVRTAQCILMLV